MAIFYTLAYRYELDRPQILSRAIMLGKELVAQYPDYPGWQGLKTTLEMLENEQRGDGDN